MLVSGPEPTQHYEGDTLVIPVLEEVLVLEKRVRLKEEVRVTRRAHREQSTQHVRLNSEEVSLEEFDERTQGGRHG
jgi:stress response protein YsnF